MMSQAKLCPGPALQFYFSQTVTESHHELHKIQTISVCWALGTFVGCMCPRERRKYVHTYWRKPKTCIFVVERRAGPAAASPVPAQYQDSL